MAKTLNALEAWHLAVRNAIEADQALPVPPGSPPLTPQDRSLWQTRVKQVIHYDMPPTPAQWLAQRADRAPSQLSLWADVAAARESAAKEAREDLS